MDKATAQRLVRNTLKAPFDRKRYYSLVNELCNGFDESKAHNMTVPDAFAAHVKSCQRLGTFTSPDDELADVLVVQLTESWKLERSRTALRDFVAHKLKRGEGSDNAYKEAGLIAFVAPDSQSWRFSYIRMDYETKRDPETGKIKTEERLTPARRYSYLVGAEEECHTAQTRFLPLLQNTAAKPTLAQLEEAFSVESVTKEFFNEYARLFKATDEALTAVRADLAAKGVSTVDFAKKLLGQIVFLYFIQKKGWLGVGQGQSWGEGPRHFLRQLADQAVTQGQCLFNAVLEPLFYDTLATDRGVEAWCPRFQCRIPFLNGGLFEPLAGYNWEQRAIALPNALFTNRQLTPSGDIGTGILDIFDRYNFTVNEAEPLEKEVAIDPEMLGKVFENLIEENRRKGLGAFYTPREIVHYMCQESLINYLDTMVNQSGKRVERADLEALIREGEQAAHYEAARKDGTVSYQRRLPKAIEEQARVLDEALSSITVCDPAIGSGAFPVGMMTEIVRARMSLTPYLAVRSPRPLAGEGPGVRVEDSPSERTAYHFKRHAIQNSLYGVDIDGGAVEIAKLRLWLSLVVDEEDVQQIKPLPNLDYKVTAGNSLLGVEKNLFNEEYFKQLEALKPKFFDESDRAKKAQFKQQIDHLIHQLTQGKEVFDFEIYFSEVFHQKGGFDVVIGNPPYVRLQQLKKIDAQIVGLLKKIYTSASKGNYDIYVVFVEKGLQLLNQCGQFAYILPHKFFNAQYGEPLREIISRGKHLRHVVHFGDQQIFDGATNYVCLLFLAKDGTELCRWVRVDDLPGWMQTFRADETELLATRVTASEWNFAVGKSSSVFEKLEGLPTKLGDIAFMFVGLQTSADTVFLFKDTTGSQGLVAKVWSKKLDQEIEIENAILKPVIRSGMIGQYWAIPTASVLFPYELRNGSARLFRDKEMRQQFPLAWKYLSANKNLLQEREHGKFADEWWQLYPKNLEHWEAPKIMLPYMITKLAASYDEGGNYFVNVTTGGFGLRLHGDRFSSRFITALLNSQVLDWYLKKVSTTFHGGYFAANKQFLVQLPIPAASPEQQKAVEHSVDRILAAKKQDAKADTTALEREIDQLVYALYGLTRDEIAVIEAEQ